MIHSTAIVDSNARLDEGVSIGPWSVIGADVEIGAGTRIDSHCIITGPTRIGRDNHIYSHNALGEVPQDKKFSGEDTRLEIGDGNTIREFCTFNRGTEAGGRVTRIGHRNWIMAYCHIAHDCQVGDDTTMANGATLAGHVTVEEFVTLGAFTVIHQFCSVGAHAFSAMGTVIFKDVPPYTLVAGATAVPRGLNAEGLKRRGFPPDVQRNLKRAYKLLYKQGLSLGQALEEMDQMVAECAEVGHMAAFIRASRRGIVR